MAKQFLPEAAAPVKEFHHEREIVEPSGSDQHHQSSVKAQAKNSEKFLPAGRAPA